jgi:DNA polymerase elongation subunit (family B)
VNGKLHTTKVENFKKFLVSEKMAISKAGVIYSQKSKGVIPNLIDEIYKERVDLQKQLHALEVSGAKDQVTVAKITYFDTLQYTLKILLNSIYGTFANKHSSLMDIDNAMSITMTGQNVAKAGSSIIDEYIKTKYGVSGKSLTVY